MPRARSSRNRPPARSRPAQQRGLADPGRPVQQQRAAAAVSRGVEQRLEPGSAHPRGRPASRRESTRPVATVAASRGSARAGRTSRSISRGVAPRRPSDAPIQASASRPARPRAASPPRGAWPAAARPARAPAARARSAGSASPSARYSHSWRGVESSEVGAAHDLADALAGVVDHDREVVGERAVVAAHDEVVHRRRVRTQQPVLEPTTAPPARTRSAGTRPAARRAARSASVSARHVPG